MYLGGGHRSGLMAPDKDRQGLRARGLGASQPDWR
ncbi:protein of unknown function [Candidatus Filomicrobium marinum]|uniref:Uncharacterized protein n=1 Tax=Candidatus Filomicrobium marinum TaxID=1608628 RepID=A0A0D6JDT1_9HYPH|nr:protein of unknown function [Candidatus Filomicrobium marinum]CPR17355.1 protein of unknown function [Candidatus Filomicrobium marinum]